MLGIGSFLGVFYHQEAMPHSVGLPAPLKGFLARVGADLLALYRYKADDGALSLPKAKKEDCLKDALGYGNAEGLLTTIFNVPVSTITALWCPGLFERRPWMPLLLRRGYLEQLVIS
jgi:deoxynucleoside triphosphate triphosphohydrolase SAMHD1